MRDIISIALQFFKFASMTVAGLLFIVAITVLPPIYAYRFFGEVGLIIALIYDFGLVVTALWFFLDYDYQPKKEKLDLEKEIEAKQKELNKAEKIVKLERKLSKIEAELNTLYKKRD